MAEQNAESTERPLLRQFPKIDTSKPVGTLDESGTVTPLDTTSRVEDPRLHPE